jgi:hypothetical protein
MMIERQGCRRRQKASSRTIDEAELDEHEFFDVVDVLLFWKRAGGRSESSLTWRLG